MLDGWMGERRICTLLQLSSFPGIEKDDDDADTDACEKVAFLGSHVGRMSDQLRFQW